MQSNVDGRRSYLAGVADDVHSTRASDLGNNPGGLAENNGTDTFRWPGVEAVMESYQRHAEGAGCNSVKCFTGDCFANCSKMFSVYFRNIHLDFLFIHFPFASAA